MKIILSLIICVCTMIGAYGQSSPKMKDGKKIIDKEMFVDMGIKSDNGNTLLWETNNWWPSSDWIPMYIERPKTFPAEQFIYKDAQTGAEYTVTARYPSIDEWKRLVNSVTLKTPRNSEEAITWYAVYPRNTNVYTNTEGRNIYFRPGPYFSAKENAFVKVIDERDAKGNNGNKLLTVLENNNDIHKAYVRRVVEIYEHESHSDKPATEQSVSTISINGQPVTLWLYGVAHDITSGLYMAIYQLSKDEPNDGFIFSCLNIEDEDFAAKCGVFYSRFDRDMLDFKSGDVKLMSQNAADDNKVVIKFDDSVFSSRSGDSITINGTITAPYYGTIEFPLGNN